MFDQLFVSGNYYLNPFAIPVILVAGLICFIGTFVFRQHRKSIVNIAFFYECLSITFWLFAISWVYLSRVPEVAIVWYRYLTFLGVVNIMPSLVFFGFAWRGQVRRRKKLLIGNFLIALLFYVLAITTDKVVVPTAIRRYFWGFYPIYGPWAIPFMAHFFIQAAIGYGSLFFAFREEVNPIKKKQIALIGIANFIGFTAVGDFVAKFFNVALYPYGYISLFIFISLVAYSIVRYRSFDIETVLHKTVMWLLTFFIIIIPLLFLYRIVFPHIKETFALEITFWVVTVVMLALYLRFAQPKFDHLFQRRRYDLEEIVSRFVEEVIHLRGISQLIQRIEDIIADTMYPQRINIYIYDGDRKMYVLSNELGKSKGIPALSADDPFLLWLPKNDKIAYQEFIDIDPQYVDVRDTAHAYFNRTGSTVVVPIVLNERLLGLINLGKKANLDRYRAADFNFLMALKNQSAIAFSNSLLYEDIERQVSQRTAELIDVQQQLIQAEKLATVGTLAGGVAHEINNPLTAILTNAQMLLMEGSISDTQMVRESFQLIEDATKRCRTIVKKLMTYAKKPLESAEVSCIDLAGAVNGVLAFITYQFAQENIKMVTHIPQDTYLVTGNQNELEQVLTNMILNAKDAIQRVKRGGTIHISLVKKNNTIALAIKDEGAGIPDEIRSKIFDPFFTTKDVGKGLGLGLSICQSIVEKNGGSIRVDSRWGEGTTFYIELPLAASIVETKAKIV